MLVESCALYAINFALFIGAWGAQSHVSDIFFPLLADNQVRIGLHPTVILRHRHLTIRRKQVIAPFLIIIRVANRSALTSSTIVSGNVGSIHFRSHGKSTGENVTLPDDHSVSSVNAYEGAPGALGVGVERAIDLPHDKV
jgi:hypothetical protein